MQKILLIIISIVSLLVIAGSGVFYFMKSPSELVTSPLQPTATLIPATPTMSVLKADTTAVITLVTDFYKAYTDCMENPPVSARGKVATYCQTATEFTTATFAQNLVEGGVARAGADPITCSQNPPEMVTAESVDFESPTSAVAIAVSQSGSGFAQKITVVTVKEKDSWMVDNISCPKP